MKETQVCYCCHWFGTGGSSKARRGPLFEVARSADKHDENHGGQLRGRHPVFAASGCKVSYSVQQIVPLVFELSYSNQW